MRCQHKHRTLPFSLSIASDSDLTANLIPALCAARVKALCPSEAVVRAGNCVEGFRSPRTPSNPPHKMAGIRFRGGDGLRPAGLCADQHPPTVEHRGNASLAEIERYRTRQGKSRLLSGALRPSPRRRRGTALAVDEVSIIRTPDITIRAPEPCAISTLHSSLSTLAPRWMR